MNRALSLHYQRIAMIHEVVDYVIYAMNHPARIHPDRTKEIREPGTSGRTMIAIDVIGHFGEPDSSNSYLLRFFNFCVRYQLAIDVRNHYDFNHLVCNSFITNCSLHP